MLLHIESLSIKYFYEKKFDVQNVIKKGISNNRTECFIKYFNVMECFYMFLYIDFSVKK